MSTPNQMEGRFAIAEHLMQKEIVIFIFETPFNVTGQGMAVIGGYGLDTAEELSISKSMKAAFDARSVVTFDEDIAARKKSKAALRIGKYKGEGVLEDSPKCDFTFTSDIMPGKWQISYHTTPRMGLLSKLREAHELVISRLA